MLAYYQTLWRWSKEAAANTRGALAAVGVLGHEGGVELVAVDAEGSKRLV
jgi:hypothetical protein